MRPVVATAGGDALVAVGEREGRRVGVIGFALDESDLPLQVAFPLLTSNLVDFLLPTADGILPSSMRLGESATATVDPRIERVAVSIAGAAATELRAVDGSLTVPGATAVGIRELRAVSEDPDLDGLEIGRTAVNLFDPDESDVTPGDAQRLVEMGRVPADAGGATQPARAEWWWPVALVALALLAVEWLLFHRPTRRSLARAVGRRPQPLGGRGP
jgi:hypothetical protein